MLSLILIIVPVLAATLVVVLATGPEASRVKVTAGSAAPERSFITDNMIGRTSSPASRI